jgi:hypothetical protein
MHKHILLEIELLWFLISIVNSVFQKISVLALQCGRIQAGHVGVVRMKSFIIGKGKGITCHTSGKDKRAVVYFRLFLYHLKLRGKERLCVITWLH